MKVTIKLSQKQEDKLFLAILENGMKNSFEEIERLDEKVELPDYQKVDYYDAVEYLKAAKIIYGWHSVDTSVLDKFEL